MYTVADAMSDTELLFQHNYDNLLFKKKSYWNDVIDDNILDNINISNKSQ